MASQFTSAKDTNLAFAVKEFSIGFDKEDWNNNLNVDFEETPCVILAGRNSGGKTVSMRSLEKFCNLLQDPSEYREVTFASFAESVGLKNLKVRFEYQWLNFNPKKSNMYLDMKESTRVFWLGMKGTWVPDIESENTFYELPDIDWTTYSQRLGAEVSGETITNLSVTGFVSVEYEIQCKASSALAEFTIKELKDKLRSRGLAVSGTKSDLISRLEDFDERFRRDNFTYEIRRRDGVRVESTCIPVNKTLERSFSEIIKEDWRPWGKGQGYSRLESFGPSETKTRRDLTPLWVERLEKSTGIVIDYVEDLMVAGEEYNFQNPEEMLRFSIIGPTFQEVSEAYDVSISDKNRLKKRFVEWDEKSDNFLGKIFSQTFDQKYEICKQVFPKFFDNQAIRGNWGVKKEEDIPKLTPTQQSEILTDLCRLLGLLDSESELEAPESASLSGDENRVNVAGRGDFLRLTATMMALHHYINIEDPEQGNFTPEHYGSYDLDDEIESGREMVRLLRNDLKGNLPRNLERQAITASSDFGLWLAATEDKTSGRDIRKWLNSAHLSSGRQRFLSLFMALLDLPADAVVMIDEPELSLHIDWQEELIQDFSERLPDLKFVWATHSPSIALHHTEKIHNVPPRDET